jgi:hypothetical protein
VMGVAPLVGRTTMASDAVEGAEPVTILVPSPFHWTVRTLVLCGSTTEAPVAGFHTCAVPSHDPVARRPPGLHATETTGALWSKGTAVAMVVVGHTSTCSQAPVAKRVPS